MMKFYLMIFFMLYMLLINKLNMFYYNLCGIISFMMMFLLLMFKDSLNMSISLSFSVEYYSIMFLILSCWIIMLMLMSLESYNMSKAMNFIVLLLMLIMFFSSVDLMLFYLMFEVSIIPTLMMIIYWGSNPERIEASYYLMIYMLMISFPLVVYILWKFSAIGSLNFMVLKWMGVNMSKGLSLSFIEYIFFFFAFFIKMSLYMLHLWLPKAHVEAPVFGSMILAGILMKMGGYGLIRLVEIFFYSIYGYMVYMISISVIGSMLMSIVCLIQVDLKSLVAYSSIVHMNMMMASLLTLKGVGALSSYVLMVGHGLCSSGLFYMVNLFYESSNSRILLMNKGMMNKLVSLVFWWFMLCVSNFSFPFSMNFLGEILILSVVLSWDKVLIINLMVICLLSSAYSLYLFSYVQHGNSLSIEFKYMKMSMIKEFIVLLMHCFPMLLLLLNFIMFM